MQEDRDILIENTRKEDERSDLKQHADGMLRDFEKFNKYSSNRAIWELVQNACDLTTHCKIELDYRDKRIAFSHNGKPFKTNSLISLIKQVSGKYGEEDIPEVGKYGTGFLTTHTFGRKFIINSVLDADGYYLPINDFEVDRTPKIWQDLSDNISSQKKKVYDLLETETSIEINEPKTTFTYLPETPKEFEYIKKSFKDLDDYIPLVFTINDRLKEVKINLEDNSINTYNFKEKKEIENDKGINLFQSIILKNNEEIHLYSIIDKEEEIEIILPIDKNKEVFEFNENIARLFFYYPLIGSEKFGINFIINCKNFLPTEPRDTIHLNSDKDQVKIDEETNKVIIDKCSDLIFSFLESNIIEVKNPLLYTNVNFRTDSDDLFLNEYFESLQDKWNTNLNELPFVNTNEGYKSIKEVKYLSEDFLNVEECVYDCFYELISKFYTNLPVKEDAIRWSNYAINWNNDSIDFIKHSNLLEKISECNLTDFDKDTLVKYYQHLIEIGDIAVFNDLNLFPNTEGVFNKIGYLLKADNLNEKLIELGKVLIPDSIAKLIHPDFIFNISLNAFNRRNFSDEVKNSLDEKDFNESIFYPDSFNNVDYHFDLIETKTKVEEIYFKSLLDFCKLTNSVDSNSKPNQLLKKISKFYDYDENLIFLANLSEDNENIEYRSIRRVLVEIFCNVISLHNNNWVQNNTEYLYELCALNDDSYKDIYKESKIYPNQLFELRLSDDLKRDIEVTEEIKQFYLYVKKEDINELLSINEFNCFLPEDNYINNRYLTTIIEDIIFQENINVIERHQHKPTILKIIPKLTDKNYQDLFPLLNEKKAGIMISVVSNKETKDDLFKIINIDDAARINLLSSLVDIENLEDIITRGQKALVESERRKGNFAHIKKIGLYIEDLIRNSISQKLTVEYGTEEDNLMANDEQGGQDIIIYYDKYPWYFIEVKSRWDSNSVVSMSAKQLKRASQKLDCYSLCAVDMTSFNGNLQNYDEVSNIKEIQDKVKFVFPIGDKIKPLVENIITAENDSNPPVTLTDYRGTINQAIIKDGDSFEQFMESLKDFINEKIKMNA